MHIRNQRLASIIAKTEKSEVRSRLYPLEKLFAGTAAV